MKRANYIAKVWKSSLSPIVNFPDITDYGWTSSGQVIWTNEEFPSDIVELLLSDEGIDSADE